MSAPVWQLSVDLQTKTATFTSGLGEAVRSARGSFDEIKSGAADMGASTAGSMTEARHGVQMLAEEFGVHLPRGVTSFLASLGPVGAAMEMAFPFLAISMGATVLIEKLSKMGEEAAEMGRRWDGISADIAKWGENSKKQLLDVEIEIDKLDGDKLKQLGDTLKQIDASTMAHLEGEFDGVAKKADEAFGKMRSGWLMTKLGMGNGVGDVQQMFDAAMNKINNDLAKGDHKQLAADLKEASDQMWGMAAPTYELVGRLHEAHNETGAMRIESDKHYQALLQAHGILQSMTTEYGAQLQIEKEKDSVAQRTITPVHNATDPKVAQERQKQLSEYMESNRQKAASDAELEIERMSIESAMTAFFAKEHHKQVEDAIQAAKEQHDGMVHAAEEQAKAVESARHMSESQLSGNASAGVISKLQEQDRIRGILQAELKDLQAAHQAEIAETQAYLSQMNALANAATDPKQKEQATLDAAAAQNKLNASARQFAEEQNRIAIAMQASQQETGKLQSTWMVWYQQSFTNLKSLSAEMKGELQSSILSVTDSFSRGFAKSLVEGKSFAGEMRSAFHSLAEEAIRSVVEWAAKDIMAKLGQRLAASQLAGANAVASAAAAPWPLSLSAPAQGAAAMGAAMAFAEGGIVPGVGTGDIVPAMLEPGEGVLSNKMMENLKDASSSDGGGHTHHHYHMTYRPQIHAIDGASVRGMLEKHGDEFERHVTNHLRKMNR